MRTIFERSFASKFGAAPIHGFRPAGSALGQVRLAQSEFSFDPEQIPAGQDYSTPASPFSFSPDYTPLSPTYPAPSQAAPLPTTRPPGTSDTDWAKILAEGFKAAASGYGIYSQAEVAKMKAEADLLRSKNPSAASILPGGALGTGTTIALVLGGIGLLGTILVVALK